MTPDVTRRKREAGAGEKTSETGKIFDELPVPGGEGGIKLPLRMIAAAARMI